MVKHMLKVLPHLLAFDHFGGMKLQKKHLHFAAKKIRHEIKYVKQLTKWSNIKATAKSKSEQK